MKIFIYKTVFVMFCVFLLFQVTIGSKIQNLENKFSETFNEQGRKLIKNKIREELTKSISKNQILYPEDRELLKSFIIKIKQELNL
tara:strand:- start:291 stop:548 length:258 start_codon:yes stop_codon:yes gene_type:complete